MAEQFNEQNMSLKFSSKYMLVIFSNLNWILTMPYWRSTPTAMPNARPSR